MSRRIDAHHHLWHYTAEEYGWISDDESELRRDFILPELSDLLASAGVDGTVAVQARQTVEETRWLLEVAKAHSSLFGVVGWLPLASCDLTTYLDHFLSSPWLKGLRHVVQAEPDGFLDSKEFNEGVRALQGSGLTYDLLIFARQLPEALRFVDRHPNQAFVVDHIAKPDIRTGEIARWSQNLRELARRPHVSCKISGMVTEAGPKQWTAAQLRPYFDVALDAFGPSRLMIGTDWPVLTVGCEYGEWWCLIESWIASLNIEERAMILGETASRVYHLSPPEAGSSSKGQA